MFNMTKIADKLSSDSKNIKLDTTVNPLQIQADIMKKAGKCNSSFSGGYVQNPAAQNIFTAYSPQQYQYPTAQIPPQTYQGQYVYNYQNWQQPNAQNAYAAQQQAYNQQMEDMTQMQQIQPQQQAYNQQMQSQPQAMPAAGAVGY